jgi:hypothetical protein
MTTRVSRKRERPRRFHRTSGWETGTDNSQAPGGTPTTEGSKPRAKRWYRLVKNSKRVETNGGESERPVVSSKRGNHPRDPVEKRGRHVMTPLEGNMASASKLVDVFTKQQRIAEASS